MDCIYYTVYIWRYNNPRVYRLYTSNLNRSLFRNELLNDNTMEKLQFSFWADFDGTTDVLAVLPIWLFYILAHLIRKNFKYILVSDKDFLQFEVNLDSWSNKKISFEKKFSTADLQKSSCLTFCGLIT